MGGWIRRGSIMVVAVAAMALLLAGPALAGGVDCDDSTNGAITTPGEIDGALDDDVELPFGIGAGGDRLVSQINFYRRILYGTEYGADLAGNGKASGEQPYSRCKNLYLRFCLCDEDRMGGFDTLIDFLRQKLNG